MKTAYLNETAYLGEMSSESEERVAPLEAALESQKAMLRYYWQGLGVMQRSRQSFRITPEPVDEYSFVLDIVDGHIEELRELYEITDNAAVERYFAQYPSVVDVLYTAHTKIREYFGPNERLALKVVGEPEAKDASRLFVLIYTTIPPREAITLLDELDREWWLDAHSEAGGNLSIDLEYG